MQQKQRYAHSCASYLYLLIRGFAAHLLHGDTDMLLERLGLEQRGYGMQAVGNGGKVGVQGGGMCVGKPAQGPRLGVVSCRDWQGLAGVE